MHLEVAAPGQAPGRLLDLRDRGVVELVEREVELDLGERVPAVLGEGEALLPAERVGGEHDVLDPLHPVQDGTDLAAVVAHPLPRRCPEEHLAGRAGHLGELPLEHVEAVLRLGAGDGQVLLQRPPGADRDEPRPEHREHPDDEDEPGTPRHQAAEAVEEGRHGSVR